MAGAVHPKLLPATATTTPDGRCTVGGRDLVDLAEEIERLRRLAGFEYGRPRVLLRVTPGVEAHTHEFVMTGQEDSKFGFSIASGAAADAVARCRSEGSGVDLVGIHCHIGSQIFDT